MSFCLLFGSTWLVNALVFFAILATVLLAILVQRRVRDPAAGVLYARCSASLAVAFVLPPESLLIDPPWLRYLLAGVARVRAGVLREPRVHLLVPRHAHGRHGLRINLLGAMVGGALEYVALLTGYQALLLVVAGLYVAAYVLAERVRLLADVDLATEPEAGPIAKSPALA